jgi:hypothetical protein
LSRELSGQNSSTVLAPMAGDFRRDVDLETGGGVEMPVMQKGAIRAASSFDQADPKSARSRLTFGFILMKKGSRRLAPANPPMANVQQSYSSSLMVGRLGLALASVSEHLERGGTI